MPSDEARYNTRDDLARVGEHGYGGSGLWGYTCSLCGGSFGPYRYEAAARRMADLHVSRCVDEAVPGAK